ncbi:methylated-DNA--[protein]-cysteine S-methyltransferase [Arthrobacter sp. ISL-30]|uniref:methylated-DNA--[protein]-cysteine S-methyltransferase n=1 Tax=Arthrobacter sp. ISL-30 TaxID=2819109 RepID=UPI001BEACDCB|nr:methylated-DNA--[protein]-cysteine S-methyltransferase [Arthrobacter sp. ISL-30]MBT2514888.1 methylated-DNA--[protein]-cysteine S-methyltransferase [Arthrobacter sp. ISL-30]
METRHAVLPSPLGQLTLVAHGGLLTGIYFEGHWHMPSKESFGGQAELSDPVFSETAAQLGEYFSGERTHFDLPHAPGGNDFQQGIWARLGNIPYGETITYGELAAELGAPGLAQAVGSAVGRNPLSIVVPCHRVLGKGGRLTGYAGGLPNKQFLLDLEEPVAVKESKLF